MEEVRATPEYGFGNVGIIGAKDAALYLRAGAELGLPISTKPTKGIDLNDPRAKSYWRVTSGRLLTEGEVAKLEAKVTVLLQEELQTQR